MACNSYGNQTDQLNFLHMASRLQQHAGILCTIKSKYLISVNSENMYKVKFTEPHEDCWVVTLLRSR